jgi:hypothetical protein
VVTAADVSMASLSVFDELQAASARKDTVSTARDRRMSSM